MTIPTQLGGELSRDDLAMWRREAPLTRTDTNRESPTSSAQRVASSRRRAPGALLVWALGRRRHPLGTLFILGGLAALVAAVAIFWVLVAIALVIGAVAFVACKGRRVPGAAWPVLLAAGIVFAAILPVSLCLTLPAGIGAALASRKTRAAQPLELAPSRHV